MNMKLTFSLSLTIPLINNLITLPFIRHLGVQAYSNKVTMDNVDKINLIKDSVPPLDGSKYKGQAGRIGIVGGSLEYTGAPYFAAISALRVGADLVHIFCANSAATVIKSYSPELIVHPLLDHLQATTEIVPWFDRLHAIVIGPGLGRKNETFEVISQLMHIIKEKEIPLVIDADGLFLISEKPDLLQGFSSPVILTPNKIEFERLSQKVDVADISKFNNVIIFKKGPSDEVKSRYPDVQWESNIGGSARRCGGQGDILSGSLATFLNWGLINKNKIAIESDTDKSIISASLSCYASSRLVRLCNEKAFKVKGRSMVASDMIEYIHEAFEELYGQ